MRGRAIIPLVVGLLVGILALKIFADVLRKAKGASSSNNAISVVYASSDIASTAEIKDSMLETRQLPRSLAPKMVFAEVKEVAGRVASVGIPRGMPIVPNLLAPKGTPPGMGARIKDGYRAVAVKVDESSGVAGWLKPGCHVDVAAVMQVEGSSSGRNTISKVLLENVEVLAVGQDIGTSGDVSASVTKSVTLAVLPQDVPKLHLAATQGTVRLAMRNQSDFGSTSSQTTDKELLGVAGGGGSGPGTGSSGLASALLGHLFAKQPKTEPDKTDKDHGGLPAGRHPAVQTVASNGAKPWRVEFLAGPQSEEIWFDDSTMGARRLSVKSDGRFGASIFPTPVVTPNAGTASGSEEPSRPTESRE